MERDTNKSIVQKNDQEQGLSSPLRFFSDDEKFVFIFKKTQKLVSALYLITGFLPENEPLKWKLRRLGSELLSSSILLKEGVSKKDKAVLDIRSQVLEVTALFSVAKQAGMISDMNFEIVNREFSLLLNSISLSSESYGDDTSTLRPGFFHVEQIAQNKTSLSEAKDVREESMDIKDKNKMFSEATPAAELLNINEYLSHKKSETHSESKSPKETSGFKEYGAVAVKKNSRQSTIISLLKRKKEIMIKDVSPLIAGCSEKTIQRELLAMVHLGILKKEGEKRWSRYSLAKN